MRRAPLAAIAIAVAVAAAAALVVAGCGTPSPDLFVVQRSGTVPGAKLQMLVSDTSVRCNRGKALPLTSAQIIQARDITDDLLLVQPGKVKLPAAPPAQIFAYEITTQEGVLRFSDTAQRPPILPRTAAFVRRLAKDTCGLTR